jgi:glycosyltransferase involved in cell wall biosynthesis
MSPLAKMTTSPPAILFVNRVPFLGGAERVLLATMKLAESRGFRPILACPGEGPLQEAAEAEGFRAVPFAFSRMKATANPIALTGYAAGIYREGRRLERLCRKHGVSLIHAHGPVAAAYAVRASRALSVPMLIHIHDALKPGPGYRALVKYAAKASPHYVAVSDASRRMLATLGVPPGDVRVVFNGVSPEFLSGRHSPVRLEGNGPHIGLFALIWPLKGQHVFLEAASLIARSNDRARFHVVGSLAFPSDQPYLDRLHAIADEPPLAGRVNFAGFRHDVPDWMAAMDVVALASVEPEALPTVVMEAMALGKKVVGTAIGGTTELIEDGVTGRLVPPNDPAALAAAIEELAALPKDHQMCQRAAATVRERFSPERFESDMGAIYDEVLREHALGAGSKT